MNILHINQNYNLGDATLEILIMLLVAFILGYLLRWLISKGNKVEFDTSAYETYIAELEKSNDEFSLELGKVQDKLAACQESKTELNSLASSSSLDTSSLESEIINLTKYNENLSSNISKLEDELELCKSSNENKESRNLDSFSDLTESSISSNSIISTSTDDQSDDLKKIEGIGPAIEKLLNADRILTFYELSITEISKIKRLLDNAGPRYRMHNPQTWPQQAGLAAQGKWKELDELQDNLKGGRKS